MQIYRDLSLKIISKEFISSNVIFLRTKPDRIFEYEAGQYFSFIIEPKVNRSYSVASAPGDEFIEFLIDVTNPGKGADFIRGINENDDIVCVGPLGFFTLSKTHQENASQFLFVGTGTGIAPLRSMIRELLIYKQETRKITLYFGLRYDEDIYLYDEFTELQKKFSNFCFNLVISRPSDNWKGLTGYCQHHIGSDSIDVNTNIYICGSTKNVNSIKEHLINIGYPETRLFEEKYG